MQQTIFDILKYADLKRDDFQNSGEMEVIRIEKKLKAAQKLNPELSMDAVEKTLNALKSNLKEVKFCYFDDLLYHLFHHLKFKECDFLAFYSISKEDLAKMQVFFTKYLEEDLFAQFRSLFQKNDMEELRRWQQANILFPLNFRFKYHQFLKERLIYIKETLAQLPNYWELKSKIPYSKSKYFFELLGLEEDSQCDEIIYEILRFYSKNSHYTIGRDFTDCILHAMYNYRPNDNRMQAAILNTGFSAGGSNKVALLAGGGIVAFCLLLFFSLYKMYTPEPRPPQKYIAPLDAFMRQQDDIKFKMHYAYRLREAKTISETECESDLYKSDPFLRYEIGSRDFSYRITDNIDLKTGDNLYKGGFFIQKIAKSDSNFLFYNNTKQPLFVMVYVSLCFNDKWNFYYPCEFPFAYNKIFVSPGDTFAFDYRFDSLLIQTSPQLKMIEKNYGKTKKNYYSFCPFEKSDSQLYTKVFQCWQPIKAINGIFSISKQSKGYSVLWKGSKETIYDKSREAFLVPNVPNEINPRKSKKPKKKLK